MLVGLHDSLTGPERVYMHINILRPRPQSVFLRKERNLTTIAKKLPSSSHGEIQLKLFCWGCTELYSTRKT